MAERPGDAPTLTPDPWATEALKHVPRARRARYDRESQRVVIELSNGCEFTFPARMGQGLRDATDEELAAVTVMEGGHGIEWEELGAELAIEGLLLGRFGSAAWMAHLGPAGERV
jgi:hypothetical protein